MSKRIINLLVILIAVAILIILLNWNSFSIWIKSHWLKVIYAAIIAVLIGVVIEYIYRKYSSKAKILQATVTSPPDSHQSMAKLVLKEKQEFIIKDYERTFGREDFLGVSTGDQFLFIGKEHFKITKMVDGFYIEDLNTKNGTMVNDEEIRDLGKIKLNNEDNILVANTLTIKYIEEIK